MAFPKTTIITDRILDGGTPAFGNTAFLLSAAIVYTPPGGGMAITVEPDWVYATQDGTGNLAQLPLTDPPVPFDLYITDDPAVTRADGQPINLYPVSYSVKDISGRIPRNYRIEVPFSVTALDLDADFAKLNDGSDDYAAQQFASHDNSILIVKSKGKVDMILPPARVGGGTGVVDDANSLDVNAQGIVVRASHLDYARTSVELAAEVSARTSADSALSASLATETAVRTSADTAHAAAIAAEQASRIAADTAEQTSRVADVSDLQGQIDGLSSVNFQDQINAEVTNRTAAVAGEASTRATADTTEASTRASADTTINGRFTAAIAAIPHLGGLDLGALFTPVFNKQVWVDNYGALGDGATLDDGALASAVTAAGAGGTLHFTPGKTYVYSTALIPLAGQVLWAYGAILKRADQKTGTLIAQSNSGTTTVTVAPTDAAKFRVGQSVSLLSTDAVTFEASNTILIAAINNGTGVITLGSTLSATYVVGSQIANVSYGIRSTAGGVNIQGLEMDGNRTQNTLIQRWQTFMEMEVGGDHSVVANCYMHDTPGDGIVPSGINCLIDHNHVTRCQGNGIHASLTNHLITTSNHVSFTNQGGSILGHVDGGIIYSNANVNSLIADNWVSDTDYCGIGSIDSEDNSSGTIRGNMVFRARGVGVAQGGTVLGAGAIDMATSANSLVNSVGRWIVAENHFYNCGPARLSNSSNFNTGTLADQGVYRVTLANNYFENTQVELTRANDVLVTGNRFTRSTAYSLVQSGSPTGGTFSVTVQVNGGSIQTAAAIPYNVDSATLEASLTALSNVGYSVGDPQANNIFVRRTGTSNYTWILYPAGDLLLQTVAFTVDASGLTGGATPTIAAPALTVNYGIQVNSGLGLHMIANAFRGGYYGVFIQQQSSGGTIDPVRSIQVESSMFRDQYAAAIYFQPGFAVATNGTMPYNIGARGNNISSNSPNTAFIGIMCGDYTTIAGNDVSVDLNNAGVYGIRTQVGTVSTPGATIHGNTVRVGAAANSIRTSGAAQNNTIVNNFVTKAVTDSTGNPNVITPNYIIL